MDSTSKDFPLPGELTWNLARYNGQWVLVTPQKVVAHGTREEVDAAAANVSGAKRILHVDFKYQDSLGNPADDGLATDKSSH
jgi:hypothetical protein